MLKERKEKTGLLGSMIKKRRKFDMRVTLKVYSPKLFSHIVHCATTTL